MKWIDRGVDTVIHQFSSDWKESFAVMRGALLGLLQYRDMIEHLVIVFKLIQILKKVNENEKDRIFLKFPENIS